MQIIPAIDLRNGQCVRLMQGRRAEATVYDGDPVEIARAFAAAGAPMLHVVDLDGAFAETNSPNRAVARRIIEALEIPVQFGGGLREISDVRELVESGAARVVVGTMVLESEEKLTRLVELFGARIAVGLDARGGRVVTRGWEKQEEVTACELAARVAALGVSRIIYTDVARDGTLEGVNVEQTCAVARASNLPVTASGGVSSLADIERLKTACRARIDSVIVGKALYEKRFTLEEALRAGA
ncbi:MAG TPA: 1-(5-phosphoribosyl)-5-[(5-phosphoribosylamino)methylideneamino]imidazole-4-carboxamide isomerase [Pyrinomonadaceae bacterium]|jgi:phosphoribosylformimino-5-aminoimidazole carboxamide ribotide isomerase|nr:1-(5-phosphoribosyl)-5-[(5-phosphoribosylamino)methylideneamino]imidazole-4-carboxamide isomerase [Pyrinomonadaceae bacterium]